MTTTEQKARAAAVARDVLAENPGLYDDGPEPVLDENGLTYCCGIEDLTWVTTSVGFEPHCGECGTEVERA